jgi:hypothetical protein
MLARSSSGGRIETGKRVTEYFETKEEAEDFIAEHRKTGSIKLADLSVQEKYV